MTENPFITTGYAGEKYFCDRKNETADIIRLLTNGNNLALISPRRYGKTDLIRHCFAQDEIKNNYYTFIVDIYTAKSYQEMVSLMGKSILEELKPKGRVVWENFLNALSSIRPGITYDMQGMPTWTVEFDAVSNPTVTLDEIFKYLQSADKPCLVAIDEFQQITKFEKDNVEAMLRTKVQYCSNARFVFSGSQRHLMSSIFNSPARPFYQSVTNYSLDVIPLDKYTEFCLNMFKINGKEIFAEIVEDVYNKFEGITYYLQRIMNELFSMTDANDNCSADNVDRAIQNIIKYSANIYEDLLYQLPQKQTQVLKAIALEGKAKNLTSGKFSKKYGLLSPSSVKAAVPILLERGLITHSNGVYEIYDKFLAIWLEKTR